MANNRLEKIGTIYSRVTGLLRSGAMKWDDKPLWYNVYRAFPPKKETSYGAATPTTPIKNIFYAEDEARARFHRRYRTLNAVRLDDQSTPSECQTFIQEYRKIKQKLDISDKEAFKEAFSPFLRKSTAELKRRGLSNENDQGFHVQSETGDALAEEPLEVPLNTKAIFSDLFKKD